jgi:hypothetical protein
MALLDDIADAVSDAIDAADLMYNCRIIRVTQTQDENGDTTETTTTYACKGMIESASFKQRQSQGFIDGDMRALVMRQTVAGPQPVPEDKFVCLGGPYRDTIWRLYNTDGDPAGATAELGARRA